MEAVAIPGVAPSAVVLPLPVLRELMGRGIHAEGFHVVLGVAAAPEEDKGMTTVEEGSAEVVLCRTVSVAVAPVVGIASWQGVGHPQRSVVADGIGLARSTLQIEQVLGTRVRVGHVGRLQDGVARVHVHVADVGHGAVGMVDNHVVGSAHQDFGLAVTVPVVAHGIILLVRPRHHVRPEVNPPQTVALDVVALDAVVGRVVGHRRAIGTVVALHDELAHAVAVHVGQGNVVDVVVVGNVGAPTGVQFLHGKLDVLLAEACCLGTLLLLHAAHHGGYLIL